MVWRRNVSRVLGAYSLPWCSRDQSMIGVMPIRGFCALPHVLPGLRSSRASRHKAERSFCCARGSSKLRRMERASASNCGEVRVIIEWAEQPVKKIRKGFEAATRRASLQDVTPHILRHTAASWSVNGGISMELTAKLLGHKNPNTTRSIYVKTDPNTLKPAADVIDMRLRRK